MNKLLGLLIVIILFQGFISCDNLDGKTYYKDDLTLNIESWRIKDSLFKVNTPFTINLTSSIPNSCTHSFSFCMAKKDKHQYYFWAQAIYEYNGGNCDNINLSKDTTITIVPDTIGKCYLYFRNSNTYKKDSIIVVPN